MLLWKELPLTEAVLQGCSVKKVFLEMSQNSQENNCAGVSFLVKLQARPATLLKDTVDTLKDTQKDTLTQLFSCEFCKISKNTFLHRTSLMAASVLTRWKRCSENIQQIYISRFYKNTSGRLLLSWFSHSKLRIKMTSP